MADDAGPLAQDEGQGRASPAAPFAALGAASRQTADAYLVEQTELTRLQNERERKEERLRNWSLFVSYASAVLKLAFEFVVALIVIVIGAAVGAALWNAAHDKGLVIEAFSVPPDLAGRGLTGEVVAGKVLDRLTALQAQTVSNRAASSYVNNWGGDIKVQIPETGVSIGELYRYLAQWLGHETHITGEIYRDASGLAVTARVGGQPAATVHGADSDLDKLIQTAAEGVYRSTQPYRFAVYLDNHGRGAEAKAIYDTLAHGGDVEDRAWAYIGLSSEHTAAGDFVGAKALLEKAARVRPDILLIYTNLAGIAGNFQHDEETLDYYRQVMALAGRGSEGTGMDPLDFRLDVLLTQSALAQALGDFVEARRRNREILSLPDAGNWENARQTDVVLCAALHDRRCYDEALDALPAADNPVTLISRAANFQQADEYFEDWSDIVARSRMIVPSLQKLGAVGLFFIPRAETPLVAIATAHLGDLKTAQALVDATPLDCVSCLRARAIIAALGHDGAAADRWFARAEAATPSTPFQLGDWCTVLLRRGDAAAAIPKCAAALAKGPHFFPAMEAWGEALIAQNRSDLALAKFSMANAFAPDWGRLHLKWGEALLWSGDASGADKQFAVAASLFLTPSEQVEFSRVRTLHG